METVLEIVSSQATKISGQRWFEWMSKLWQILTFEKKCLEMYVRVLGVFCILNNCFECFYDIQCHFLYIWTYFKIYFDIFDKLKCSKKTYVYIYIYIYMIQYLIICFGNIVFFIWKNRRKWIICFENVICFKNIPNRHPNGMN